MTLLRKRIVAKAITVTAAPKARRRGILGVKPTLPAATVAAMHQDEYSGAQAVIHRYNARVRNPMTAIRAKCIECSGGSPKEVSECRIATCSLHPFRMGSNPFNKRTQERMAREAGETEDAVEDVANEDDEDAVDEGLEPAA